MSDWLIFGGIAAAVFIAWFVWCALMVYSLGLAAGGVVARFGKTEPKDGE